MLHNRRGFVAFASQILDVAYRQRSPAVLLLLDIDNMKELNDHHSDNAGVLPLDLSCQIAIPRIYGQRSSREHDPYR